MPDGSPAAGVRIERLGEAGLLVVLGDRIDAALNDEVHRLAAALRARGSSPPGIGAAVPGYASVFVPFDPLEIGEDEVRAAIHTALAARGEPSPAEVASTVTIRVRYGGADGPDLAEVAARLGRTEADVVRLHAGSVYRVFVVASCPASHTWDLPERSSTTPAGRRPAPASRPRASPSPAARQASTPPHAGGWHLIGRTRSTLEPASRAAGPPRPRPERLHRAT